MSVCVNAERLAGALPFVYDLPGQAKACSDSGFGYLKKWIFLD
jgi:hypothetical protein